MGAESVTAPVHPFSGQPHIFDEYLIAPSESHEIGARSGDEATSAARIPARIRGNHDDCILERHLCHSYHMADALRKRGRAPCKELRTKNAKPPIGPEFNSPSNGRGVGTGGHAGQGN